VEVAGEVGGATSLPRVCLFVFPFRLVNRSQERPNEMHKAKFHLWKMQHKIQRDRCEGIEISENLRKLQDVSRAIR
jgi:hypothetical protein